LREKGEKVVYVSDFEFSFHNDASWIRPDELEKSENESIDILISVFQLQSINNIIDHIGLLKSKIKENGILLLVFPGHGSFSSLRKIFEAVEVKVHNGTSPRFFPMIDVKDAGAIAFRMGFKNVVSDVDEIFLNIESINKFASFIRGVGLGNCISKRDKKYLTKQFKNLLEDEITKYDNISQLFQLDLVTVTSYKA
jgi:hypothetical protein